MHAVSVNPRNKAIADRLRIIAISGVHGVANKRIWAADLDAPVGRHNSEAQTEKDFAKS